MIHLQTRFAGSLCGDFKLGDTTSYNRDQVDCQECLTLLVEQKLKEPVRLVDSHQDDKLTRLFRAVRR